MRTRAIHAGARPDPTTGARAVPIYQTTSFVFEDTADAADLFSLQKYGNIYTRLGNPTVAAFEERVASLEGGIGAVATSSGQAAETLLFTQLCDTGDHIVASSALYGGTYTLLNVTLRRLGIETTFVAPDDPAAFAAAVQPGRTKLVYTEIVANPAGTVADLEALAKVAHDAGVPLAVDSTLASPYLCRPLDFGADIVLHSATKYLGGHGTSIGGAIVDSGRFPWDNGNFPVMTEPVATYGNLRFWDNFGEYGFATKLRVEGLRNLGRRPVAVQRVPDPAGHGDAAAADGRARRQRAGHRRMARRRPARELGPLRRAARRSQPCAGQEVPAQGPGRGLLLRL